MTKRQVSQRAYYERNRDKVIAASAARRKADPRHDNALKMSWYYRNRGKVMARKYGITPEQYAAMLEKCGSKCEICGSDGVTERYKVLAVDHCHETGAVRGMLCGTCNKALGAFKDSPELLRAAAAYLERSK